MSSTSEPMGGGGAKGPDVVRRKLVNTSLVSLKCLLFLFFGGMHGFARAVDVR